MNRLLKIAKGAIDFTPEMSAKRRYMLDKISSVFKAHGGHEIDTPVFELCETLKGKYGEDEKLIYELKDQGGEQLGLRYDLTVPFARYALTNSVQKMKRYQIGKVYRRDNPSIQQGRLREFLQCDFDILGHYEPQLADAEIIAILGQSLEAIGCSQYQIRVNHKFIVNGILEEIGVVKNQNIVTSSVDKLDKIPWDSVYNELISKGLRPEQINKLHELLGSDFKGNDQIKQGLQELDQIQHYASQWGIESKSDRSLMRGLDYYTGMVLEADVATGCSIAGGGRYDKLCNNPCVGMSLGIDRLMTQIQLELQHTRQIAILSIGNQQEIIDYMIKIQTKLYPHSVICLNPKWKLERQIEWALDNKMEQAIIVGSEEQSTQTINFKDLITRQQSKIHFDNIKSIL